MGVIVEQQVSIDWIRVAGRHRKQLRDLDTLAQSIKDVGLMNAVTVTPDGRLVAGQRRLAACRQLGWQKIAARIVDNLDDAADRLRAERDENTQREPMLPSELVSLGLALEALERPRAAARKVAGVKPAPSVHVNGRSEEPRGETREIVASALGMSTSSYQRAKTIVAAATDPTLPEPERRIAQEALADMDDTGLISPSFNRVKENIAARTGKRVATTIESSAMQRRAVTAAITAMSGIVHGLAQITEIHPDITSDEAVQWVDGLAEARRVLDSLIKRLKERSNAQV